MVKRYRRRSRATAPWSTGQPVDPVGRKLRSRWRPGYWLRHPAFGLAAGVLMAGVLVACGFGNLNHRNDMVERGERATGAVLEQHGRQSLVSVHFTTRSGAEVTTWVGHSIWDAPSVGEEIDVIYDRADPIGSAYVAGDEPGLLSPILFLGGGPVLALAYAWWLRRSWNRLRSGAESWRGRHPVPRLGAAR
ncbi:hypothetical protein GCM10011576_13600 [Micromonospora parathelypteridis]|nr:hypothetical protein GCM10011576_13600 [Micromonospora parathelypteridis]